jgi:hypothetical protein
MTRTWTDGIKLGGKPGTVSGRPLGLVGGLLFLVGACQSQDYTRGSLWLGAADGGADLGSNGDLARADSHPASGTGGNIGQVLGSGGDVGTDAGELDLVESSGGGGPGAGGATGGIALDYGTGGAVAIGSTGGVGAVADRGTGGMGTGGSSSGGVGTGGSGTGGRGTGGSSTAGTGGVAPGTGGVTVFPDPANYNFESSGQSWGMSMAQGTFTQIGRSTAQHYSGGASLAGSVSAVAGKTYSLEVSPPSPAISAGAVITFEVYIPTSPALKFVQPYVQEGGASAPFHGAYYDASTIKRNDWNTLTLTVPAGSGTIAKLGVQFGSNGTWTDTVYVDSIDW